MRVYEPAPAPKEREKTKSDDWVSERTSELSLFQSRRLLASCPFIYIFPTPAASLQVPAADEEPVWLLYFSLSWATAIAAAAVAAAAVAAAAAAVTAASAASKSSLNNGTKTEM